MRLDGLYLDPRVLEESVLSKTAAAVAMAMAFGFGGKAISQMLNINGIQADQATVAQLVQDPQVQREAERMRQQQPRRNLGVRDYAGFIEPFEGRRYRMYRDTVGVPTIGVGFNLNRFDAAQLLAQNGTSLQQVMAGQPLTDQQINALLMVTTEEAADIARQFVNNFDQLPDNVKMVLVSMAFNLGPNRLAQFVNFRQALERNDFNAAANEMVNSRWYSQVGNRGPHHVNLVRTSAN